MTSPLPTPAEGASIRRNIPAASSPSLADLAPITGPRGSQPAAAAATAAPKRRAAAPAAPKKAKAASASKAASKNPPVDAAVSCPKMSIIGGLIVVALFVWLMYVLSKGNSDDCSKDDSGTGGTSGRSAHIASKALRIDGDDDDAEAKLDRIMSSQEAHCVAFFHGSCGHCKSMKPEWDKASQSGACKYVEVYALEGKKPLRSVLQKYNVQGFPTLIMIKNGKKKEYSGPRTATGIHAAVQAL